MDRIQKAQAGWSLERIAETEGVSTVAVRKWFYRRGLTYQLLKPANYQTIPRGYERWNHKHGGESFYCYVHRLAAIAEHGVDAVQGKHVHHVNGVPWDNRPENLVLLEPGEHAGEHLDDHLLAQSFEDRERGADGAWV